jgi:hypothetical protein
MHTAIVSNGGCLVELVGEKGGRGGRTWGKEREEGKIFGGTCKMIPLLYTD